MIGRVLDGRFRVDALLGEGGLGQVFRGTHLRLGRSVAIKVMHAHHVNKPELRTRFDREARSLAALAHPNVVGVIDYGVDGEAPFLVMDLLEGRTLDDAIKEGLPQDRVVPIFRDILRAVAYAHGIGLVHRDLKPANVFLQRVPELGEVVRVLDFGLAKFVDGDGASATVTRAGMVIGTPSYMSPEQATASAVDARADVYSLGIVLFELITGERPFTGDDGAEVLRKHLLQPMPSMRDTRPDAPLAVQLERIVTRATEKSKADRYTDAGDMAAALDAIVGRASTPEPTAPKKRDTIREESIHVTISDVPASVSGRATAKKPRPKGAIAAGIAVIVLVLLAWGLWPSAPAPTEPPHREVPTSVASPPTSVIAPPTSVIAAPTTVVTPPASIVAPPTTIVAPPTTIAPPATSTPDPWSSPIPPQLAAIETRVRSEREISRDQREMLYRFSSNHPHDPRGLLLLGHAEVIASAYLDACHRYQHAYDVDHDARFDPAMRHDLVTLATRTSSAREAARMVQAIYGAEALDEITIVAEDPTIDAPGRRRLAALRTSITR
jgi:serine/threonine-protein kinase